MTAALAVTERTLAEIYGDRIAWAFEAQAPVRASESQGSSGTGSKSRILIGDDAFDRAAFVRKVHALRSPEKIAWLKLTYGEFRDWDMEVVMIQYCWGLWLSESPAMHDKTVQHCKGLMNLASQEARRIARGHDRKYKPAELQRLLGVKPSTWRDSWKSRWERMLDTFAYLDYLSLTALDAELGGYGSRFGVFSW